jgi:hypothetical protein
MRQTGRWCLRKHSRVLPAWRKLLRLPRKVPSIEKTLNDHKFSFHTPILCVRDRYCAYEKLYMLSERHSAFSQAMRRPKLYRTFLRQIVSDAVRNLGRGRHEGSPVEDGYETDADARQVTFRSSPETGPAVRIP